MAMNMSMTLNATAPPQPHDRLFAWLSLDGRRAATAGLLGDVIGCRLEFVRRGQRDTVAAVAANPDPTRIPAPGKVYLGPDATLEECIAAALREHAEL